MVILLNKDELHIIWGENIEIYKIHNQLNILLDISSF